MSIFCDEPDRLAFLERLEETSERFEVACHAYCQMTNHYHLVLTTALANLSAAVKHLNGTYGQWWNRRHNRVGHVFQGRFASQVVQDDSYLITVSRYVVLNPVRAGQAASPGEWPWSSYRATAGLAGCPSFLRPEIIWRVVAGDGCDLAAATRRYQEFVAAARPDDGPPGPGPIIGDAEFSERFRGPRARASPEVPRRERESLPPIEALFAGAVSRASRNARVVQAHALGYSMAEIARCLNLHYCTISRVLTRDVGPEGDL